MTADQLRDLSRRLSLLTPSEAWPFVFTAQGPDGFPLLLVARDGISPAAIRDLLRWAPHAELVRGLVVRAPDGVLLFDATSASPPADWKATLRAALGAHLSDLADAD